MNPGGLESEAKDPGEEIQAPRYFLDFSTP